MKLSDFSFELPESLIAQFPTENRTDSRLLVSNNDILDDFFRNLGTYLEPGDLLVLNDTKVIQRDFLVERSQVVRLRSCWKGWLVTIPH